MFDTIDPEPPVPSTRETYYEDLTDDALCNAIAINAADITVAEFHHVLLIAEFDRRAIWNTPGCRSAAEWLSWRCGTSMPAAREQVRVGRALEYLPLISHAFGAGEISYSKVRAITRIATKKSEKQLLEWARAATAAQLERIVSCHRREMRLSAEGALEKHRRRYVRHYTDQEGMVVIEARLSPEDGAVVLQAIEAARQALRAERAARRSDTGASSESEAEPDVSAETCDGREHADAEDVSAETHSEESPDEPAGYDWAAGRADGFVEVCRSTLTKGLATSDKEPAVSVMLHVDEQVLANPSAEGCSYIEEVGGISPHTARRLACDAGIFPLMYRLDGQVEAQGKTRSIPGRMRQAILARDQGCRWPGCPQHRFVDVHHIVFWSNGGKTTPSNLVSLCKFHHRLVHEGGYRLEMDSSGRVQAWTPDGIEIPVIAQSFPRSKTSLAEQHSRAGMTIDENTMDCGYAEPFDIQTTTIWLHDNSGPLPWESDPGSPTIN